MDESIFRFHTSRSTSDEMLSGLSCGDYLFTGFPSRLTRNFVQFHLIRFVQRTPRFFATRNLYIRWAFGPLTSTLEKSGTVTPYLVSQKFLISASEPGS